MLVKIISKFNCQSFPLDETAIEVEDEVLEQIGKTKCFDVENNCVIAYDNSEDIKEQKLAELRAKRKPLLQAFDSYKTNVFYGIVQETAYDKVKIIAWYEGIKALDEMAIDNIPDAIKYYL